MPSYSTTSHSMPVSSIATTIWCIKWWRERIISSSLLVSILFRPVPSCSISFVPSCLASHLQSALLAPALPARRSITPPAAGGVGRISAAMHSRDGSPHRASPGLAGAGRVGPPGASIGALRPEVTHPPRHSAGLRSSERDWFSREMFTRTENQ